MKFMNLTELSYYARKAIPFVILFLLVFMIMYFSVRLYLVILESNKPKATYTQLNFGRLDKIVLKEATNSGGFNYTLDTVEGVPVTATEAAKIFFMPEATPRFGYREKIYLMAKSFGFDTEKIKHKLVDREATFTDNGEKLTIDIGNFNFKYESNIQTSAFITGSVNLSEKEIENKAVDFLKSVGRYPDELSTGPINIIYLKYDPSTRNFINVDRRNEASAVEVDFYRPNIDNLKIATPRFFNSQNYVVMTFNLDEIKIIRAQVAFFEKSEEQTGIYPLKTGQEAWDDLVAGRGMVVAGQAGLKNILIKKMDVYYLDPAVYQTYLQPVYVFLGDNDFVAYVQAVNYIVQE